MTPMDMDKDAKATEEMLALLGDLDHLDDSDELDSFDVKDESEDDALSLDALDEVNDELESLSSLDDLDVLSDEIAMEDIQPAIQIQPTEEELMALEMEDDTSTQDQDVANMDLEELSHLLDAENPSTPMDDLQDLEDKLDSIDDTNELAEAFDNLDEAQDPAEDKPLSDDLLAEAPSLEDDDLHLDDNSQHLMDDLDNMTEAAVEAEAEIEAEAFNHPMEEMLTEEDVDLQDSDMDTDELTALSDESNDDVPVDGEDLSLEEIPQQEDASEEMDLNNENSQDDLPPSASLEAALNHPLDDAPHHQLVDNTALNIENLAQMTLSAVDALSKSKNLEDTTKALEAKIQASATRTAQVALVATKASQERIAKSQAILEQLYAAAEKAITLGKSMDLNLDVDSLPQIDTSALEAEIDRLNAITQQLQARTQQLQAQVSNLGLK